ncbi:MAG: enoyl-CoA hydratase-related protein [Sphingomonadales bacterium]
MTDAPAGIGNEVLFDVGEDHIALVTLNRPEKYNAVNEAVALAMDWAVKEVDARGDIRVAILTSSNDKVFCAGADLSEIAKGRAHTLATKDGGFGGLTYAKRQKPWIAAVTGSALAGGCEFALSCDMIVASENSGFGLPEPKRGLLAAAGGVYRLGRALPRHIALELVATGDPLPAQRAYDLGLINYLEAQANVLPKARELAAAIAANAPLSVIESLGVARQVHDHDEEALQKISGRAAKTVFSSEDAKEGPLAFVEKRKPVWSGR